MLWWSSAPPWGSSVSSKLLWWSSALLWRSSKPSALLWSSFALSWRSKELSALLWWFSAPPWRSSKLSALLWWSSASPWPFELPSLAQLQNALPTSLAGFCLAQSRAFRKGEYCHNLLSPVQSPLCTNFPMILPGHHLLTMLNHHTCLPSASSILL